MRYVLSKGSDPFAQSKGSDPFANSGRHPEKNSAALRETRAIRNYATYL